MPKRMLIDASHPEETRVVVLDGNRVEEFDFEAASKRPLKGNIYLAKVTRVEPSLQAAFVEYGGNRQGFLAFSEIHPDYYQIPVADRIALLEAQTQRMLAEEEFDSVEMAPAPALEPMLGGEEQSQSETGQQTRERSQQEGERASQEDESGEDNAPPQDGSSGADNRDEDEDDEEDEEEREENEGGLHAESDAGAHDESHEESQGDAPPAEGSEQDSAAEQANAQSATPESPSEPGEHEASSGETPSREPSTVQAESTGAPESHRRRGPRQSDRHRDTPRPPRRRQYKIQEVIKRRQIMLVQVVKEERGNKGASLTTFLSLAGRYCVLMPNTPRGGGISRKITNLADRKRLKSAAQSLELPEGMGLIIRTAGANRTKLEIKRDYEYLLRLWDTVRELTLKSNAPALVYEEGSLIKRVIRDLYSKDISEIVVDGDAGYRDAKDFMRMLMPSHAKNVKPYKEPLPLFQSYHVEAQLDAMFSPVVQLKSGGYIVINQTEALVAIDVNSGKATREHSIEETAHKTNLEAADEIGRQLRLRDLAGLIVLDFIDMEDSKNDRNVEKRLHNAVRGDRARIQIGKISQFGLLEMSRQRLRAGVLAGSTVTCPHCNGQGLIRSTESAALRLLRSLDEEGQKQPAANVTVRAPSDVTIYTLNQKRRELARIEEAYDLAISFDPQQNMMGGSFEIERTGVHIPTPRLKAIPVSIEAGFQESEPEESEEPETDVTIVEAPVGTAARTETASAERSEGANANGANGNGANGEGRGRKRRRRRRGGRGRGPQSSVPGQEFEARPGEAESAPETAGGDLASEGEDADEENGGDESGAESSTHTGQAPAQTGEGGEVRRRRRRRGRRGRRGPGENGAGANDVRTHGAEEHAPGFGAADAESPVIAPNADSSPLWSLADQSPQPVPSAEPRETRNPAMAEAVTRDADVTPPPAQAHYTPAQSSAAAASPASAAEEGPKDSRKGWWQRRFKM